MKKSARLIVLGASGFIGRNILAYSSKESYDAKGYSSKECDLLSEKSTLAALSGLTENDALIMASSITRTRGDDFEAMTKNILMAENLGRAMEKHKPGYLIFLSSIDVYGQLAPGIKISECMLTNPNNYYGISKLTSELILKKACAKNSIPLLIMRLSGVYGADDEAKSTIGKMIASARKGELTIFGDGKDLRDFVYVKDISRIIKEALSRGITGTFNIATGKNHSLTELAETIKTNADFGFMIKYSQKGAAAAGRSKDAVFDTALFKKSFPDFKFTMLREGIREYIKHLS